MSTRKKVEAKRVFVCHECGVAGAAVDEDCCCTGCGCDLDAYEENVYHLGPGLTEPDPEAKDNARIARAARRAAAQAGSNAPSCDDCEYVAATLRRAIERADKRGKKK